MIELTEEEYENFKSLSSKRKLNHLTSDRVKFLLRNPELSKSLGEAIRDVRRNSKK